jgi:hypothetical protein
VLHGLGATPDTPVTILSDGADGPRSLGEAASVGPTHHVLDWFHLSMRIQHVAQAAGSWPDIPADDRKTSARLTETIERIRWRLWRGQVTRGLELIREAMTKLEARAGTTSPSTLAALKVVHLLSDLETYVCGQSDIIIDYATAPAPRGADFDGDHGKHGAMAAASQNECSTANAVDATRRASDAQGSMRGIQWYS